MHNKTLVVVLIILFCACNKEHLITFSEKEKPLDSIAYHYDLSKDKTKDLNIRYQAINNAYKRFDIDYKGAVYHKVLYQKSVIHYSLKQIDSLKHYNALLLDKTNEAKDIYYEGKGYYLKAYYFDKIKFYSDSAYYYYNKSKNNFLTIKDSSQIGRRLLNMAYVQQSNSDFFGSKETITDALRYLLPDKDAKYIASAYNVLAISNKNLLNNEDAIKYYEKAIANTKSNIDRLVYKNNLSIVYIKNKKYKKAIELFRNILSDSLLHISSKQKARLIDNYAYARWLKDTLDIEKELLSALHIRTQENDKRGLIASYKHLGEYFSQKNRGESLKWFDKMMKISKSIKNPKGELEALNFLMEMKPEDLNIKTRYIQLTDSLQEQELQVKTQFAKIRYDDQLKVEEIHRLKDLTAKQELEVSFQRTQKIIYLLIGVILVLIIVFVLYYLMQKHRKDTETKVYNTERRISKKVHDELANDISSIINFIENTQDISTFSIRKSIGDKLQNIYLRARDISTEMTSIDVVNFQKELKNLIQQYNNQNMIVITNVSETDWSTVPDYKKIAVFRVVQELFINTIKHSKANKATLMVKDTGKHRIVTYKDNGIGAIKKNLNINGLANAENRIENIKGEFIFETSPDEGFIATIMFQR